MTPIEMVYLVCLTAGVHAPVSPTSLSPAYAYASVIPVPEVPKTVILQVRGESATNRRWTVWSYREGTMGTRLTINHKITEGIEAQLSAVVYLCKDAPTYVQITCHDSNGKLLAQNVAMALKGY